MASTDATRRAALDVLAHGLRGDLAHSDVGVRLGYTLSAGAAADIAEGATRGEVLEALRDATGQDAVAYARLLELYVLSQLDEAERSSPDSPPEPSNPRCHRPAKRLGRCRASDAESPGGGGCCRLRP